MGYGYVGLALAKTYDRQAPPCTKHIIGGGDDCGAATAAAAVELEVWGGRYKSKLNEGWCGPLADADA